MGHAHMPENSDATALRNHLITAHPRYVAGWPIADMSLADLEAIHNNVPGMAGIYPRPNCQH